MKKKFKFKRKIQSLFRDSLNFYNESNSNIPAWVEFNILRHGNEGQYVSFKELKKLEDIFGTEDIIATVSDTRESECVHDWANRNADGPWSTYILIQGIKSGKD